MIKTIRTIETYSTTEAKVIIETIRTLEIIGIRGNIVDVIEEVLRLKAGHMTETEVAIGILCRFNILLYH